MLKRSSKRPKKNIKEILNPFNYFASPVQKYLRYGKNLFEQKQHEQAIAAYKAAIREDPKCLPAYLGIGDTYMAMGGIQNSKTSIKYYQRALGIDYTQVHIYHKIIKVYDRLGDNRNIMVEKKKIFIAKTLKNDPENALANNNMGVIQLKQKNYNVAIKFFTKAIQYDKSFNVAQLNLAKALFKKGISQRDSEKRKGILMRGISELEKLILSGKEGPEMLLLKAKFLFHLDEPKQALALCDSVIVIDGTLKEAFATKSMIETKLGKISKATASYESFQSLKKAEIVARKQDV